MIDFDRLVANSELVAFAIREAAQEYDETTYLDDDRCDIDEEDIATLHDIADELDEWGKASEPSTIALGKLEAALAAGAHPEFVAFVGEFPDSCVAETLERAIAMDALDDFPAHAGSFEGNLWKHGASGAGNPDTENADRMRALFAEDQLPQWMQDEGENGGEE